MKNLALIIFVAAIVLFANPLLAWERRGPQNFTVTNPDGSMTPGQYVPTPAKLSSRPQAATVTQRDAGNNWQTIIQPVQPPESNIYNYVPDSECDDD